MNLNRNRARISFAEIATAIACCVCLGGCDSNPAPTYPAGGRVVFPDGSPVAGGNIEFAPQEGAVRTSARAMIGEDGTFRLSTFRERDGAIEGTHRVLIVPGRRREDRSGSFARSIDPKYQSFETSGLEAKISPDSQNEFEFVVSPPGQ